MNHDSFRSDSFWRSGSMRYVNAVILDLMELKHARTESTGKLKIQQSEEYSGNVNEDHNSLKKKAEFLCSF